MQGLTYAPCPVCDQFHNTFSQQPHLKAIDRGVTHAGAEWYRCPVSCLCSLHQLLTPSPNTLMQGNTVQGDGGYCRIAGNCRLEESLPPSRPPSCDTSRPRGGLTLSHQPSQYTLTTLVTISTACLETVKSFTRGEIMCDTLSHILTVSSEGLEGSVI